MYDTYALLKAEGVQFPPVNENIDGILLETSAVSATHSSYTLCSLIDFI
jgi:hypothetical protein